MSEEKRNEVKATEVKSGKPSEIRLSALSGSTLGLLLLTLVLLGLLTTAFAIGKNADTDRFERMGRFDGGMMRANDRDFRGGKNGGMMGDDSAGSRGGMRGGMMGGDVNSATSTRVMGVVTAVDGDTITVAGNGAATKVVVNDNTNYTGDDKPAKVNDTIMASGARQSDGTLLASTVRLSRQ